MGTRSGPAGAAWEESPSRGWLPGWGSAVGAARGVPQGTPGRGVQEAGGGDGGFRRVGGGFGGAAPNPKPALLPGYAQRVAAVRVGVGWA